MIYIYQILAMILIGTSVGAILSRRDKLLTGASVIAVILGIVTLAMPAWPTLVIGAAIFLIAQAMQREPARA